MAPRLCACVAVAHTPQKEQDTGQEAGGPRVHEPEPNAAKQSPS